MESLKVLIINPFTAGVGGAETFSSDLKKALEKKYTVDVATTFRYSGTWQGWPWGKAIPMMVRVFFTSLRLILMNRYERIYCLGLISCFIGFLFFWERKSAVMLCMYDFKRWNPVSIILNSFDKVFVEAGEPGAEEMRTIGVKPEKIIKFTEWVDQTKFYPVAKNNKRLQVLFVGRPIKIKGRHIIEEVEKELTDIDFVYVDNVPYDELPAYYQKADICVVPSLYSEGSDRVVAEAASCGCIVIASNRGALKEMVSPFGFVVEPSARNFKDYILWIKNNPRTLDGEFRIVKKKELTINYAKENFSDKNAEVFL